MIKYIMISDIKNFHLIMHGSHHFKVKKLCWSYSLDFLLRKLIFLFFIPISFINNQ